MQDPQLPVDIRCDAGDPVMFRKQRILSDRFPEIFIRDSVSLVLHQFLEIDPFSFCRELHQNRAMKKFSDTVVRGSYGLTFYRETLQPPDLLSSPVITQLWCDRSLSLFHLWTGIHSLHLKDGRYYPSIVYKFYLGQSTGIYFGIKGKIRAVDS